MTPRELLDAGMITSEQFELAARMEAFQERQGELEREIRRSVLRFAPVLCRCLPWHSRDTAMPNAGCLVHGQFLVGPDGELVG